MQCSIDRPLGKFLSDRRTFDNLHRQQRPVFNLIDLVNGADIGVV
jgi:hypothetical protein